MIQTFISSYSPCTLCPRTCRTARTSGQRGFCGETDVLKAAWAGLHFGEEPPITAAGGSGTIFITGCNLHCAFCQNYQISQMNMGRAVTEELFVNICLKLQNINAENINIITGSHSIPVIAQYLHSAKIAGLTIPVCWNSSAYETSETLELLADCVDIWLPDLKTLNPLISSAVFDAADYPAVAKKAIRWMIDHTKTIYKNVQAADGSLVEKMISGVIVRHLALPGRLEDTRLVLDWFKKHADTKAFLSIMSQYTPVPFSGDDLKKREKALGAFQNRWIKQDEFQKLQDMIESFDIQNGFYQELEQDTEWLPDFTKTQPFSSALAKPVWHWKDGFIF